MKDNVLKGKNCLITGATGGIGRCIAHKLAAEGCRIFLTSTSADKLTTLSSLLNTKYGSEVFTMPCNLNETYQIKNFIEFLGANTSIDILINCAGVYIPKPMDEYTLADYDELFNVNVRAAFLFSKAFAPGMVERKWGRIVNIGSTSSYVGRWDSPLYCASKHAILGLSRSLHDDLKRSNIRVFCISPGATKTPMGDKIKRDTADTFIKPEEIAEYIAQVISFDSTMVSEEIQLNRMWFPK